MSDPNSTPGTWQNALRELELSVLTDADRERIDRVRQARERTAQNFKARYENAERRIKVARADLRRPGVPVNVRASNAYGALDWRSKR